MRFPPNFDDLMVSDKHVESNHRKHRRSFSPSDEVFKSPKRHKSRHHHRRHGHRHHRDEEVQYNDDENVNGGDLDMEEGEILGKEGIGETLKKKLESVDEFGDIKSGQFRENNLVCSIRPFTSFYCFRFASLSSSRMVESKGF